MKILDLVQGTDEWLEARLNYLCASEAAAMMGESKYMTREDLLALKKGWQANPVDGFKQKLFDSGHESEAAAREILEEETCEPWMPAVGAIEVDGIKLLASFDGLNEVHEVFTIHRCSGLCADGIPRITHNNCHFGHMSVVLSVIGIGHYSPRLPDVSSTLLHHHHFSFSVK